MGVLDDAIREHLDLKRRHGAEEDELRRQEEEALGPARREVAPAEAEDGNGTGEQAPAEIDAADTAHVDQDELPDVQAELEDEPELPEATQAGEETAVYELPPDEREPHGLHDEPPAEPEPLAVADSELDEEAELVEDEHVAVGETPPQGFEAIEDDEQLPEEDEEPSDEDADLLEDTPDFLQEAPEHDRLWFEQKPPRDFDFD